MPKLTFTRDAAFSYEVRLDDRVIGRVGNGEQGWHAKSADFDLGTFKTRKEAADALIDIDRT